MSKKENFFDMPVELRLIDEAWEFITPDKAESYLETMNKNRGLKKQAVNRYKHDFISNEFSICYDSPIIFNRNGEMVNGQHRCEAVVETGEPFWCKVYRNVPNNAVIDKGVPRSTSDSLNIRGIIGDNLKSAKYPSIVNAYINAKHPGRSKNISENQIGNFMNHWEAELIKAKKLSSMGSSHAIAQKAGVQAALFAAIVNGEDEAMLERMMSCVNTGFLEGMTKRDSAAIILRKQLDEFTMCGQNGIRDITGVTDEAIVDFTNRQPRTHRYKGNTHTLIDSCPADIQ